MTTKRLTIAAALACIVAWLYRLGARGRAERERRDALLLSLSANAAYKLGYAQGMNGVEGHWPELPRTVEDDVPGVGGVWRESTTYRAYWHGYEKGQEERDG